MGNHFDENHRGESGETVTIHPRVTDVKGSGKIDSATGRYVPVGGGSRTRIPISDDKRVSRYAGNIGLDASLSGKIDSMAALYAQLDSKTKEALGADFPAAVGRPELAEPGLAEEEEEEPLEFMTQSNFETRSTEPGLEEGNSEEGHSEPELTELVEEAPKRKFILRPPTEEDDLSI